ncbi:hypothetical protein NIES3585_35900 [Nodularia sp. NIES-3585]|nr:hypothetical protein NIES3585_35900 [Nodularia sp. NIES-3585]
MERLYILFYQMSNLENYRWQTALLTHIIGLSINL